MSLTAEILSKLPGNSLEGLRNCDRVWESIRENHGISPQVIRESEELLGTVDYDIIISGGTLGILIASTLVMQGWRVALIERGILRGRVQEWNISRPELKTFCHLNLLTEKELEDAIVTEYNPARISFPNSPDIWVKDVLNIGVDPVYLLETIKNKFIASGGKLLENTPFERATIHPDGVLVKVKNSPLNKGGEGGSNPSLIKEGEEVSNPPLNKGGEGGSNPLKNGSEGELKTRLFIDAMGHFSPIVKQARKGQKPDAICLVVGTCAQGFPQNETGDLFASFTPMQNQCQYFWEAFPARDGRTTYLFTYIDADKNRVSLESFFEEYFRLLPEYQNVELNQLEFRRALYGFFPCYRQSPLKTPWNRLLFVGDSSGSQSPLSFGGFGAMVRHLPRLTQGIHEALQSDLLDRKNLALLQPYQPSISVTWLFQRSMSAAIDQKIDPNQINQLLTGVFQVMEKLGEPVLKPFLQDIVQFTALSKTLFLTSITQPLLVIKVVPQVGLQNLIDWMIHYINLGIYSSLSPWEKILNSWIKNLPPQQQYYYHRLLEAWRYGAGKDYEL
jgi:lycopene cyclase CruP